MYICAIPCSIVLYRQNLAGGHVLDDIVSAGLPLDLPSLVVAALVGILNDIGSVVTTIAVYIHCKAAVHVDDLVGLAAVELTAGRLGRLIIVVIIVIPGVVIVIVVIPGVVIIVIVVAAPAVVIVVRCVAAARSCRRRIIGCPVIICRKTGSSVECS